MSLDSAVVATRYFEAVHRDPRTTAELYSPDVVLHYSGAHSLAGDYVGTEAILKLFERSRAAFAGKQRLELHDLLGSADHAVALLRGFAELEGATVHWKRVVVFHVRAARIVEQWILDDDQDLLGRLLGAGPDSAAQR